MTTFDQPHAHHDDIDTSHEAAATNTTHETHQRMILAAHFTAAHDRAPALYDGYTDEEVGRETGLPTVEARRRCNNLRNMGYLEFNGETHPGLEFPTKRNGVSILTHAGLDAINFPE